jgi:hypothetical protein
MVARPSVRHRQPQHTPHGPAGDRFVTELRGNAYYVFDAKTGGIVGGPYRSREAAQSRADALQTTVARR